MLWQLAGRQYVGAFHDLGPDAPADAQVLLLEDWEPTERFIDDTVRQLSRAGAIVFLVAVVLSIVLSRRMSRPLRDIAERASDIAAGDWNSRLTVRGSAEAVAMAEAFNGMTESLSHWHAQAQERTRQLQSAYERYAAVTNSAPDAIISTDADGIIGFWNRSAATIFGCSEEDALGRTLVSLFDETGTPIGTRIAAVMSEVRRTMDPAVSEPAPRTFEANARRNDGTTFPCELTVAAWTSGGAAWLTAIVRDITERRRAEETLHLRDAQLRQAQKMEAVGRLASGVAHDFNNALAVVQGYTEDIMQSLGESHEHHRDLGEVLKASRSAASLTRQLLAFSRKQAIAPQVVSMSDVVDDIQRMIARLVGDQIALTVSLAGGDDVVYADRGQIEQVLVNLCVNARDAMADGGRVAVSVTRTNLSDALVCARLGVPPGDYVTLSVADTGHGMDASTAAHIFEPFFTTKDPGRGTGLGLATVYGIVRQSGGGIDLETSPGRGTTFRVHLPVSAANLADVEAATDEPAPSGAGTVLLVEDEPPLRAILRRSLETAGYAVLEAASGDAALAVSRSHPTAIHVLLTDVVMPGMNGIVLSRTMADERPRTRVLFMSGHAADTFARHGFDPVSARFLQKPFSTETLFRELREMLSAA
jgi:PAS domain S-box-containing protein